MRVKATAKTFYTLHKKMVRRYAFLTLFGADFWDFWVRTRCAPDLMCKNII